MGRTNLYFLCKYVLGYTDVSKTVHGDLIKNLQQFDGGYDKHPARTIQGKLVVGTLKTGTGYRPVIKMQRMTGHRKTLNLISRGHLKTTVATVAHSIQWILNYPDIRILLSAATDSQVKSFLKTIKGHFQTNEAFRYLYPEYCPQGNVYEFGNQEEFTVPCRSAYSQRQQVKEPTVKTITVGSVIASGHYDVIKHDDVVDKENIRTPDQIKVVQDHIEMTGPLLERYNTEPGFEHLPNHGWVDFVGTRYHFSDLYGKILEDEASRKTDGLEPAYSVLVQPALKEGKDIFDPKSVPLWPERFPLKELQRIFLDPLEGGSMFLSQYMMQPVSDDEGLINDENDIVWIPKPVIDKLYARMNLYVAVDLAGMENTKNADNDYTVITLGGFDRSGALYALEVHHGRPDVHAVINILFELIQKHPRIRQIKVEKEAHARVLLPFLKPEMVKRGVYLPILALPRDNQQSKKQKIKALQPWFKSRRVRFNDGIPQKVKDAMKTEIIRFPKWHDDFLDTLRDLMDDAEGGITSDAIGSPKDAFAGVAKGESRFLGFQSGSEIWADGGIEDAKAGGQHDSMVGCL